MSAGCWPWGSWGVGRKPPECCWLQELDGHRAVLSTSAQGWVCGTGANLLLCCCFCCLWAWEVAWLDVGILSLTVRAQHRLNVGFSL